MLRQKQSDPKFFRAQSLESLQSLDLGQKSEYTQGRFGVQSKAETFIRQVTLNPPVNDPKLARANEKNL